MSIIYKIQNSVKEWPDCFYCGKTFSVPMIHWMGTDHIYIHPDCVGEWFEKLNIEAMEIRQDGWKI